MGSLKTASKREATKTKMADSRVPMTMRDFFFDDPFFKSSWDNFDQVRERMFQESRDMWKKFDQDFRDMACMSNNIMIDSGMQQKKNSSEVAAAEGKSLDRQNSLTKWENGWMFPRRWMLPSLSSEFKDMNMEVSLDTSQYRPDELNVSVFNGVISVEGKHEEKAEDGTKMVSRQFIRKYTLPAGSKPQDVVSNLSSDGVLVITANKANPAIEQK